MAPYTTKKEDRVDAKSAAYERMCKGWELAEDVFGGTPAMRKAAQRWLPQFEKEHDQAYRIRLNSGFLFPGAKNAVQRVVSKPFSRNVSLKGDLPEKLKAIEKDVDRTGRNLTQWAREWFEKAVKKGLALAFIDFPKTSGQQSNKDEAEGAIRPYWVQYDISDLIGFRWHQGENGAIELTEIRLRQTKVEPKGQYGEQEVEHVFVFRAPTKGQDGQPGEQGSWELHRVNPENKDEIVQVDSGTHTFPGIPLVALYVKRTGLLEACLPFEDLLWLNVAHWQSSAIQRDALNFGRIPIMVMTGVREDEKDQAVVSPRARWAFSGEGVKVFHAETSGQALGLGNQDISHLEDQMEVMGMQPFMERTADQTATGKEIDSEGVTNTVQEWVMACESALRQCYEVSAKWVGEDLDEEFQVDIFSEFGIRSNAVQESDVLLRARMSGELSRETFLRELRRRSVMSEEVDIDDEIARIEEDAPDRNLGLIGLGGFGAPQQEDDEPPEPPQQQGSPRQGQQGNPSQAPARGGKETAA